MNLTDENIMRLNDIKHLITHIKSISHWERPLGLTDYDIERMNIALDKVRKKG